MAHITKKCNCRDQTTGRQLGQQCPQLGKRSHGAWWFRYEAPPGPDGKRRRPWSGPHATKTDAERELTRLQAEAVSGAPVADRAIKVGPYLDGWLDGKRNTLKPSTWASYRDAIELYHKPALAHLRLHQVSERHLEELYEAMQQINNQPEGPPSELLRRLLAARAKDERGKLWDSRPIGPARIGRIHAVIRSALGSAVKRKILAHNPATHVELPAAAKRRPLVWTPTRVARWQERLRAEEAKEPAERRPVPRPAPVMVWTPQLAGRFLDEVEEDDERLYPLYHLVATRGLRRGEVWALEWSNVELDAQAGTGWLAVREDEHDGVSGREERASVKSDAGWRTIGLDAVNVGLLARWRARQAAERLAAGDAWQGSGRVFTDPGGASLRVDYISEHFDTLVKRYGMPPIRFHDLRHCAATLMLAAGVDMKVVSETLGHRQYSFTADTYTSVVPELAAAAAEATVAIIPRRRRVGASGS